jgi:hypothetical protein
MLGVRRGRREERLVCRGGFDFLFCERVSWFSSVYDLSDGVEGVLVGRMDGYPFPFFLILFFFANSQET